MDQAVNNKMNQRTYEEYLKLQLQTLESFESNHSKYQEGQDKAIDLLFTEAKVEKLDSILDICCGDGVGLRKLKKDNYQHVYGVELNKRKYEIAEQIGYPVSNIDFHDLSIFQDDSFDVVYSSHSIEHAYDAKKVISELIRVLKKAGKLIVIIPYPDKQENGGHDARIQIKSNIEDSGKSVREYFESFGLTTVFQKIDSFREPEIWFIFQKNNT